MTPKKIKYKESDKKETKEIKPSESFKFNYKKLGFKCGLEIHQQLDTSKLFCSCPSLLRDDSPDFTITRYLRAAAGEQGEVDIAAQLEQRKSRQFTYEFYHDTTCLVELDAEPPHQMNPEALNIVLQVSQAIKADIVDKIQVMRKTVVDGSNTSGFQRTALIATHGSFQSSQGEISIPNICLEEEAARIIEKTSQATTFRLDRLGIPLIEIATGPDIKDPAHCHEVALFIGMLLRSTGRVKRGLGTIRQDVNISIKDGARVEIKGCQDLKLLPKLVENEVLRQLNLIKLKKELKKRKAKPHSRIFNLTKHLKNTQSKILAQTLKNHGVILALKLEKFSGLLGKELQPNRRLGTELSDHAKLFGLGGIFHSDELPAYGLTEKEVKRINQELKNKKDDTFILLAHQPDRAELAAQSILGRLIQCFQGVPKEVRTALPDATTSFMRPMPGSARMYPETDIPLIAPDTKNIPPLILLSAQKQELKKIYQLTNQLAQEIIPIKSLFEQAAKKFKNLKPLFIADFLVNTPKDLKARYKADSFKLKDQDFLKVLESINNNQISKDVVPEVLLAITKGASSKKALEKWSKKEVPLKEVKAELQNIIKSKPGLSFGAYMGLAMQKFKGQVDGKTLAKLLQELLK